jgi:hypothetical protein
MNPNDAERQALRALLQAHPDYGLRRLSINQCLRCRVVPEHIKQQWRNAHKHNSETKRPWQEI